MAGNGTSEYGSTGEVRDNAYLGVLFYAPPDRQRCVFMKKMIISREANVDNIFTHCSQLYQ